MAKRPFGAGGLPPQMARQLPNLARPQGTMRSPELEIPPPVDELTPDLPGDLTDLIEPRGNMLLVRPVQKKSVMPSGIVIPQEVLDRGTIVVAEVLKVGAGDYSSNGVLIPMDIKPGDHVCYGKKCLWMPVSFGSQITTASGAIRATAGIISAENVLGWIRNLPAAVPPIPAPKLVTD